MRTLFYSCLQTVFNWFFVCFHYVLVLKLAEAWLKCRRRLRSNRVCLLHRLNTYLSADDDNNNNSHLLYLPLPSSAICQSEICFNVLQIILSSFKALCSRGGFCSAICRKPVCLFFFYHCTEKTDPRCKWSIEEIWIWTLAMPFTRTYEEYNLINRVYLERDTFILFTKKEMYTMKLLWIIIVLWIYKY